MTHNIKIYKTMIQLSMILAQLLFIMNAVNQGEKKGEREWGGRTLVMFGLTVELPKFSNFPLCKN